MSASGVVTGTLGGTFGNVEVTSNKIKTTGALTLDTTKISTTGSLSVGETTITGDATVTAKLSVGTSAQVGDISISNGSITSTNNLGINLGTSNITIGGDMSLSKGLTVTNNVTATGNVLAGTMTVSGGSITDSSGSISFGNENVSTTGTLAAGATTVTGTMSASGVITGTLGGTFGNVEVTNNKIKTTGALALDTTGISTAGTLAAGETTITGDATVTAKLSVGTSAQVGDITISNGSITSTNTTGINFGAVNLSTSGSLTSGDVTINGSLTVTGSTTTVNSENVIVNDPIMVISSGTENNPVNDAGLIIERGNVDNVGLLWIEGTGKEYFAAVKTTSNGSTEGSITTTGLTDMRVDNIIVGGSTLDNLTVDKLVGVTGGTVSANKTIITDVNSHIDVVKATELHLGETGATTKVDSTAAELNLVNTSSAGTIKNNRAVIYGPTGEINAKTLKLDSVPISAGATDINKLAGLSVTGPELDQLSGITDGTAVANKVLIPNLNKNLSGLATLTVTDLIANTITGTTSIKVGATTITESEIKALDGVSSGSGAASKALVLDAQKDIESIRNLTVDGTISNGDISITTGTIGYKTTGDLLTLSTNKLEVKGAIDVTSLILNDTPVTANATDINKLASLTADASELNILDGVTGVSKENINTLSGVTYDIHTKFGTKLDSSTASTTYALKTGSDSFGVVGDLSVGSIISGFTKIDMTGPVTTTGKVKSSSADLGTIRISGSQIGTSTDLNLLALDTDKLTVNGDLTASSLTLGLVTVTADATDINLLDGQNISTAELNSLKSIGATSVKDQLATKMNTTTAQAQFAPIAGASSIKTVGDLSVGSIVNGFTKIDMAGPVTTTGKVKSSSADLGTIRISGSQIGTETDLNLLALDNDKLTVNGNLTTSSLTLGLVTVTADAADLNILNGQDITTAELNSLKSIGATSVKNQLAAKMNTTTAQTQFAPVAGGTTIDTVGALSVGSIASGFGDITLEGTKTITAGTITGTSVNAGNVVMSGSNIGLAGDTNLINLSNQVVTVDGTVAATTLKLGGTTVDAGASDINKLNNLSTTYEELGYVHGLSSSIQTQLDNRYTETEADTKFSIKAGSSSITTVGAVTSGSVSGDFGPIDITKDIKTSTKLTSSSADIGSLKLSASTIGHSTKTDLVTLSATGAVVDGALNTKTLLIDDTLVSASATDINKIAGLTGVSATEFGYLSSVTSDIQTQIDTKITSDDGDLLYASIDGGTTIDTVGAL